MMWSTRIGLGVSTGVLLALGACDQPKTMPDGVPAEQVTAVSSAAAKAVPTSAPSPTAMASADEAAPTPESSTAVASSARPAVVPVAASSVAADEATAKAPATASATSVASAAAVASASVAAKPEPAPAVTGAKQAADSYAAWMQSAARYTAGKAGTVQAVLIAKDGFKCNPNYPYKFKLGAAPAGVAYPQVIARNISKGDKRSVLTIPIVPSSVGKKTISGTFHFSVCNDEVCHIKRQALSVQVDVQEPGES